MVIHSAIIARRIYVDRGDICTCHEVESDDYIKYKYTIYIFNIINIIKYIFLIYDYVKINEIYIIKIYFNI